MKVKIMHQVDWRGWDDRKGKVPLLEDQVNEFIADKKIIDIKYSNSISMAANQEMSDTDHDESVLIIYDEKPSTIKQKTFEYVSNDSEINDFTKKHDVIKIEHFGALDDVTTIITYKEDN
ncbi:hypothetical protein [Lactobacillus isalae]|uniref:hypothetical protein n=1 Tax=Lactobacillus isalae TaxID=2993455 RepID=UPI0024A9361C|nr:hypothetical protein [Lactobacillus isalae]